MSLSTVIKEANIYRKFCRQMPIDPRHVSIKDSIDLFRYIDRELSPEHLHQDGERSPKEAQREAAKLRKAAQVLLDRGYKAPINLDCLRIDYANRFSKGVCI
jgi:hypothetical protein